MTFMSERINSLTNVVMEMSNTLKRIKSTSNLQGSTSSAENFSHMLEIIEKPTKSFLNCQQSNYTQEQVRYFLNLWLRYESTLNQDDDADTRLLKRMRFNTYYQDLYQWLAETLLAYMYRNRQSKRKSRKTASEHEFPESDTSQSVSYEQMSIASQSQSFSIKEHLELEINRAEEKQIIIYCTNLRIFKRSMQRIFITSRQISMYMGAFS
ncbi:hypothetical protein BD560DRAFT_427374 [Blakeslea trispora]|nr:hypothetical protein BD560DRAFT_427374 [Blakeslea trispora]